jgi:hypothetical protein
MKKKKYKIIRRTTVAASAEPEQSAHDQPHDKRLKELFGNKEAFISLLKDCVKPDWIDELDEASLKMSNKSFVLQDFRRKEADVVYEGTLNKGKEKVIFYILQENQRQVDYRMPYRLLLYIVEILRHYYNNSDINARRRKDFKFPAVFPIIFFNGRKNWTVPQNLKEMFSGYKKFGDYLINFNYALVDVKGYGEENIKGFKSKLLKVMMLFEKSTEFIEILDTIEKHKGDLIGLNDEEKRIISLAFEILSKVHKSNQEYNFNEILYAESVERVSGVLPNLMDNVKNYERNLIKKAKKEAKEEIKKEFEVEKKGYEEKIKQLEEELKRHKRI